MTEAISGANSDVNDDEYLTASDEAPPRPVKRADCRSGVRPCPWASCKWHLLTNVGKQGELSFNVPGRQLPVIRTSTPDEEFDAAADEAVDSMFDGRATCALDLIEESPDGMTLLAVAEVMGLTRERIRQIEAAMIEKLERRASALDELEVAR